MTHIEIVCKEINHMKINESCVHNKNDSCEKWLKRHVTYLKMCIDTWIIWIITYDSFGRDFLCHYEPLNWVKYDSGWSSWAACVTVKISGGWEDVVFTMAGCQTPHCAKLLSAPDVIPLAREGTQSQSTDSSISHFIIGPPSHSKSHHCFGSVLWCCSFFLCKLVWSAILSSSLWRACCSNREVVLSFRAQMNTLKISTQVETNSSREYHRLNI